MAMWRCPHCATPQPEAARCWVCHRSSTCCATCRDFRRSVAGDLGFCGLDTRRSPLRGDELRGCWRAAAERAEVAAAPATAPRTGVRNRRDFVPLEPLAPVSAEPASSAIGDRIAIAAVELPPPPLDARWSLFPDLEP